MNNFISAIEKATNYNDVIIPLVVNNAPIVRWGKKLSFACIRVEGHQIFFGYYSKPSRDGLVSPLYRIELLEDYIFSNYSRTTEFPSDISQTLEQDCKIESIRFINGLNKTPLGVMFVETSAYVNLRKSIITDIDVIKSELVRQAQLDAFIYFCGNKTSRVGIWSKLDSSVRVNFRLGKTSYLLDSCQRSFINIFDDSVIESLQTIEPVTEKLVYVEYDMDEHKMSDSRNHIDVNFDIVGLLRLRDDYGNDSYSGMLRLPSKNSIFIPILAVMDSLFRKLLQTRDNSIYFRKYMIEGAGTTNPVIEFSSNGDKNFKDVLNEVF